MLRSTLRLGQYAPRLWATSVCNISSTRTSLAAKDLVFTFGSPKEVFYDKKHVKQVDVPTLNGSMGILAEHVPILGCLKPGVVTVYDEQGNTKKFFVSSGTVTVNADSSMQVLAEEAVPVDQLDGAIVREGLSKAQHAVASANGDVAKAEAQIELDCYDALAKALER